MATRDYTSLEEATFRLLLARDLEDNDQEHLRIREEVHTWIQELKATEAKQDSRIDNLLKIATGLLIAVVTALLTGGALGIFHG